MLVPRTKNDFFELSPIKAMELAAARVPGVISLAQGIPSFPTPAIIKDFVTQKLAEGLCDKYSLTIGLSELREEISSQLAADGLRFDPDREMIVTCGSIEGITASILALTEPGAEVILPSPTYVSYQGAIGIARCTPRFVPLDEDRNFDFHVDSLRAAVNKRTRAILFSNPNNPTGTLFSKSAIEALCKIAQECGIYIITDEVYKDFYYTKDPHYSPVHIPEARPWVVRACSFSKAFAMTGWRVGFVHADRTLIDRILKFHDAMVTCAPVISQYAAIAALRHGQPALNEFRLEFKKRRDFVLTRLDAVSHAIDYQVPKATYFVFPRIKDTVALSRDSRALALDILEKSKLALVPGVAFGPSGESHLRISFGKELSDLTEGMARFEEYLSGRTSLSRRAMAAPSAQPSPPTFSVRNAGTRFLVWGARTYLRRHAPLVVGIAGVRGKTYFKRTLAAMLSHLRNTRATTLSFNTPIGVSLSLLGMTPPKAAADYAAFPWRVLYGAFLDSRRVEVQIIEYGIGNRIDAEELLKIAVPDWLVLTNTTAGDANLDYRAIQQGIGTLAAQVPADRIIWSEDDPFVQTLPLTLKESLRLPDYPSPGSVATSDLLVGDECYSVHIEAPSRSAAQALHAAILLARRLGATPEQVRSALLSDDSKRR